MSLRRALVNVRDFGPKELRAFPACGAAHRETERELVVPGKEERWRLR